MRRRRINGDIWADVFSKGMFSGRTYRLGPGQRMRITKVGSILVGPKAMVEVTTPYGTELLTFRSGIYVKNMSMLATSGTPTYVWVSGSKRSRPTDRGVLNSFVQVVAVQIFTSAQFGP
jgi:hypothetical protein